MVYLFIFGLVFEWLKLCDQAHTQLLSFEYQASPVFRYPVWYLDPYSFAQHSQMYQTKTDLVFLQVWSNCLALRCWKIIGRCHCLLYNQEKS